LQRGLLKPIKSSCYEGNKKHWYIKHLNCISNNILSLCSVKVDFLSLQVVCKDSEHERKRRLQIQRLPRRLLLLLLGNTMEYLQQCWWSAKNIRKFKFKVHKTSFDYILTIMMTMGKRTIPIIVTMRNGRSRFLLPRNKWIHSNQVDESRKHNHIW